MISSRTGDEKDWLCTVGFCPRMIRKLGCIPRTLLATWSAMQICPTRALCRFLGDPDASAYELLFSLSTPEEGPVPRSGPLT